MKKYLFCLLTMIFAGIPVSAQKKIAENDLVKILSGDISAYKMFGVKKLNMVSGKETLYSVEYSAEKNRVTNIFNGTKSEIGFNENLRPIYVKSPFVNFQISYLKNNPDKIYEIRNTQDSVQSLVNYYFPYKNRPDIIWKKSEGKNIFTGKILHYHTEKFVLNPKDSLWNYNETENLDGKYLNRKKTYKNLVEVRSEFLKNKRISYDSTFNKKPEFYSFSERYIGDTLVRHSSKNGIYGNIYLFQNKKIKSDYTQENHSFTTIYDKNELPKTTMQYYYLPEKGTGHNIPWRKIVYDYSTKKSIETYPNKHFYRIKNDSLVLNKNIKISTIVNGAGCGMTSEVRKIPLPSINIYSNSILVNREKFTDYFDTDITEDLDLRNNEIFFSATKLSLRKIEKSEIIPNFESREYDREILHTLKASYKFFDRKECSVEIIFNDNSVLKVNPKEYLDKVSPEIYNCVVFEK